MGEMTMTEFAAAARAINPRVDYIMASFRPETESGDWTIMGDRSTCECCKTGTKHAIHFSCSTQERALEKLRELTDGGK